MVFVFSELFLIVGSRINFVKIRACSNFRKLCACISSFVQWEEERKSNDGKANPNNVSGFLFPPIVAKNSS